MKKTASFFLFLIFLFAADNPVSAALPSNELWREGLINNVVGFGRNTTGGAGGALCRVTNLNNSGTGSLRACAEATGPQWIVFDVSGTITLTSNIYVKSDKTIDGRGQNIVVSGHGFILGWKNGVGVASDNIIFHNITIKNITADDGISINEDASNVWIDHCTFESAADEMIHVGSSTDTHSGAPPYGVTISWNHFVGNGVNDQVLLVSDYSLPQDVAITITLHHNHYDFTYSRHPLARFAKIHSFNNYYDHVIIGVDAVTDLQFYSENEIFYKHNSGSTAMVKVWVGGTPGGDPRGALTAKVLNPMLLNGATVQQVNESSIFNPTAYYAYTAETANSALQTKIVSNAGWQNVTAPISLEAPTNLAVK
jgi:pectate lyase